MIVRNVAAIAVFSIAVLFGGLALAEKRVALVIGNGAYQHTGALDNPPNDARLIGQSLAAVGFEVHSAIDADKNALSEALKKFGRAAQNADVAMFYYAGHGLEAAGQNWLLPIDSDVQASSDLPQEATRVNDVLQMLEFSEAKVRVIVLDACRNNPLSRSLTRSTSRGLGAIDASAAGTMIVFAAAPGEVALDGAGTNSPFSQAFARRMSEPGLEIRRMMGRVREDVLAATGQKQVPWVNEAIAGDFFLVPGEADKPKEVASTSGGNNAGGNGSSSTDAVNLELTFWNSVKDSGDKNMLRMYQTEFPNGTFHGLAETMIAAIDKQEASRPRDSGVNSNTGSNTGQPLVGGVSDSLEQRARNFILELDGIGSGDGAYALGQIRNIYGRQVSFHGKPFTVAEIVKDKERFFRRWPQRSYVSDLNTAQVFCNPSSNRCDVEILQNWQVYSPERNQSANGVQRNFYKIDFSSGSPVIVVERAENASN